MINGFSFIVPGQYPVRFAEGDPPAEIQDAFDGDPTTPETITIQDGNFELDYIRKLDPEILLINVQTFVSDLRTRLHYDDGGFSTFTFGDIYAENEDRWRVVGSQYLENVEAAEDEIVAVRVSGGVDSTTLKYLWEDPGAGAPYSTKWYQIIIGDEFQLPPPDMPLTRILNFPERPYPARTQAGNFYPNFSEGLTTEKVIRRTWTWTGMTEAQKEIFKDFIKSFHNSFRPFYIVFIADTVGSEGAILCEFFPAIILGDSVSLQKRKTTWDASFQTLIQKRS